MEDAVVVMFEEMVASSGLDMTVEEILEMSGITMDDFYPLTFEKVK